MYVLVVQCAPDPDVPTSTTLFDGVMVCRDSEEQWKLEQWIRSMYPC
jgi:hypothetical protein